MRIVRRQSIAQAHVGHPFAQAHAVLRTVTHGRGRNPTLGLYVPAPEGIRFLPRLARRAITPSERYRLSDRMCKRGCERAPSSPIEPRMPANTMSR